MDKKDYLDISKATDIKDLKERKLYRFFETLPGLISLGTLLGVLVLSWLFPSQIAIFIISFCFYYLFRIIYFSIHQIVGYFKVKKHLSIDWMQKLEKVKDKDWRNIYHLIILPTYKEKPKIIKESLDSLINSNYPKEKLIVVLAIEERAGAEAKEIANL